MQRLVLILCLLAAGLVRASDVVIAISVDGLGSSYLQRQVDAGELPAFKRLEAEGAWTLNARADFDVTITLPNHTSMITSRPIKAPGGHGWTLNTDPPAGMTIHSNAGYYVASLFDVAHDFGFRTGLWSTKSKFSLFATSYDAAHGAADVVRADNGRNKLDLFRHATSCEALTDHFLSVLATQGVQVAFVHFGETDGAGHAKGWGSPAYTAALVRIDACIGRIEALVTTNPALHGRTTLILTADHGGKGRGHGDAAEPLDYTVPFLVWGAGVTPGDLYTWNRETRKDPGVTRPRFADRPQPIRNAEVGNLALELLGLDGIPQSTINASQDLRLGPPPALKAGNKGGTGSAQPEVRGPGDNGATVRGGNPRCSNETGRG